MTQSALLTVGSTEYTALVEAFLSPNLISYLASAFGITSVYAQIGNSALPTGFVIGSQRMDNVRLEVTRFASDLEQRVGCCDLVVSHAGAGSILSFLRPSSAPTQSRQLILVPNDTLMDSHQSDLADEMETKGWAKVCRDPRTLSQTLAELAATQTERQEQTAFPPFDKGKMQKILDQTLGYL
ncbi:N-acetylglucosaminyldiphosphodolichol N-acetylglucosaminyltransferase catalytic subunit ALG13 [Sporobolomyces koalae]|uniref:N-acetylglucosaminyldiphosphodolichol N-acetylglucosaminyltransferase catalytic subunit ALG13 n=1 Tax=Sporobolomyces koalae TaxID=500713 RepID=UPI00318171C9